MQKEKSKYEQQFYAECVKTRELNNFAEDKDRIIEKYKKDAERSANRLT